MARRPPKPEPEQAWVFGESPLRGAWDLVRARPALWAALSVPSLLLGVIQSALMMEALRSPPLYSVALMARSLGLLSSIVALLFGLAMAVVMSSELMAPSSRDARQALRRVSARFWTLLGLGCVVIVALVPVSVILVIGLGVAEPSGETMGRWEQVTVGAWYIMWLAVAVRLGFVVPAAVVTSLGVRQLFGHAWNLTSGKSRYLTPYYLLMTGPQWLVSSTASGMAGSPSYPHVVRLAAVLFMIVIQVGWTVFSLALTVQLWYRLRAEKEGLGLERAAREAGVA